MAKRLKVLQGVRVALVALLSGEFGYCTDTRELFIGTGNGNEQIVKYNEVTGSSVLTGTDVSWKAEPIRTKTLTAATTLTFSSLIVNKTITLLITGNYALTLPASVKKITGEYDGTKSNLIQFLCVNTATPEVWCVISQEATV